MLDELHTYRGRQGADVALLVRRLRERLEADQLVCIGTSATMSSTGTQADRNQTVAGVASLLFGTSITENDVIGETLQRVTNPAKDVQAVKPLLKSVLLKEAHSWADFGVFSDDALAIWVELTLGIELPADEPPRRAKPITLKDASSLLAADARCTPEEAMSGLQRFLVAANDVKTPQGRAPFAFKLHQFISGPGKVLATLEPAGARHITLDAQRFAPGRQEEGAQLYRQAMLDYWGGACAVTGLTLPQALRASHAKPWAKCLSDVERLDVFNGFLLSANLDSLFDSFLISFTDDGALLVAKQIRASDMEKLGLNDSMKLRWVAASHLSYLHFHRGRFLDFDGGRQG